MDPAPPSPALPSAALDRAALEAAFALHSLPRERREVRWTAAAFASLVPLWWVADLVLEPALAPASLLPRLGCMAVALAAFALARRAPTPRALRGLLAATYLLTAALLVWLVPLATHFWAYVAALSLWYWGVGLGALWPVRWGLGVMVGLSALLAVAWSIWGGGRTGDEALGAAVFLASATVIGAMAIHARRRSAWEVFEISRALGERNAELADALARVRTLSGLLPVCAWCKRVRDDAGYWQQIERYLSEHTDARFTHGMCEDCAREHYPEIVGHGP